MADKGEMEAPLWESIRAHASKITLPSDFLSGLNAPCIVHPENILLFCQHHRFGVDGGGAHHRFVFIVALETSGSVIIDDKVHALSPGQGVIVMPYQFHHYADFAADDLLWLFITFELPSPEPLLSLRNTVLNLDSVQRYALEAIARLYLDEGHNVCGGYGPPGGDSTAITLHLGLILHEAVKVQGGAIKGEDGSMAVRSSGRGSLSSARLLSKVAAYVHTNLERPIQAVDVAAHVGLSVSHLRGRFKKSTGVGIGAYIRRSRLHRASGLMRSTDRSLTDICRDCGFESLYSFSRTFRHEMGMTPTEFRERGMG